MANHKLDGLFTVERKLAMAITEKTYEGKPGTGYQYFRTPEGHINDYNKSTTILFMAVEFEDSCFLAGPFEYGEATYGLVSVNYRQDSPTKEQYREDYLRTTFLPTSCSYMPYSATTRVQEHFGKASEFWYDDQTKSAYSDLDLKWGKDEIPLSVFNRLRKSGECALFFNTQKAAAKVRALLTFDENSKWDMARQESQVSCLKEIMDTGLFAETPYRLHLQGSDDCSWEKNFATLEDVIEFIELMKKEDSAIVSYMTFTN